MRGLVQRPLGGGACCLLSCYSCSSLALGCMISMTLVPTSSGQASESD